MADRVEVSKSVAYVATGQPNTAQVSKCVAYVVLIPSDEGDTSNRQGHVHTQILRRD